MINLAKKCFRMNNQCQLLRVYYSCSKLLISRSVSMRNYCTCYFMARSPFLLIIPPPYCTMAYSFPYLNSLQQHRVKLLVIIPSICVHAAHARVCSCVRECARACARVCSRVRECARTCARVCTVIDRRMTKTQCAT